MKARGNRTHCSGASNRVKEHSIVTITMNKGSERFERSFNKSQSLYTKTAPMNNSMIQPQS